MYIFTCEDRFEDMMCCIYQAWEKALKVGHGCVRLEKRGEEQPSLFDEYVHVEYDEEEYKKVVRSIKKKISNEAIDSAKANAARMGDAVAAKSRFFCADAGQAAARLAAEGLRPDVIMLDPPRKGCDETTLSAVVQMSPRRVVYVSCNPSTAARDAAWLEEHGYHAEKVQPVDLFPRTRHVEAIVSLQREI